MRSILVKPAVVPLAVPLAIAAVLALPAAVGANADGASACSKRSVASGALVSLDERTRTKGTCCIRVITYGWRCWKCW